MRKYDWLLFDADQTLFDFDGPSLSSFKELVQKKGYSFTKDIYKQYQKSNKIVWKELEKGIIDQIELRSKRFRLFLEERKWPGDPLEWNKLYLDGLVKHAKLFPLATKLLDTCKRQYKLAIITNGLKEVQRPRIEKVNIKDYFEAIIVSDEIGSSKPASGFFDFTFKQIGNPDKSKVLVVGDNLSSDIVGGINYKIDTCWINWKNQNHHPYRPTYIVSDLKELIDLISNF